MGEDLDSMSLKDLQNLEQQLDSALKLIRSRKVICLTLKRSYYYVFMLSEASKGL